MRFNQPALMSLHKDITEIRGQRRPTPVEIDPSRCRCATGSSSIDVHYSYPLAERQALQGLSFSIPAQTTVGIVGGTGAGKTTAVDLILGLLDLQEGTLAVDGVPITARTCAPGRTTSATCRRRSS